MDNYSSGYVMRIMALDAITTIIGLSVWVAPFALGWYPGGFTTTLHVALGALITTLGAFRVLLAYRSEWVEIVLLVLGLFVFLLPHWLHMEWNGNYTTAHRIGGGVVMAVAVISGLMTIMENKKHPAY
jgi:hypothetical protein